MTPLLLNNLALNDQDGGIVLVDANTPVSPGRGRPRSKTGVDETAKKPADSSRKKAPPARKAPSRGRYVDEYARPVM